MRRVILLLMLLSIGLTAAAQRRTVTGHVVDSRQRPVGHTSIIFYANDSTLLGYVNADSLGHFAYQTEASPLTLMVMNIAFATKTLTTSDTDLGDIVLADSTQVIDEVTVNTRRPTAKIENNRLVYDADAIAMGTASTSSFDVLQNTPGVMCLDGKTLQLVGTLQGTTILVNGKPKAFTGDELADYLKSIPKERVKKVEVIYQPTPDIQSNGPTLNLVLRRYDHEEHSGMVSTQYGNQHANTYGLRASAFLDLPRWSFTGMLATGAGTSLTTSSSVAHHNVKGVVTDITTQDRSHSRYQYNTGYLEGDYKLDDNNTIGLVYSMNYAPTGDSESDGTNHPFRDNHSRTEGQSHYHDIFLTYTGRGTSAGVEYMNYIRHSTTNMDYDQAAFTYGSRQRIEKWAPYVNRSRTIFKTLSLAYGASLSYTKSSSWQNNTDYLGQDNYSLKQTSEETLAKVYVGLQGMFFKKLYLQAYLREEFYKYESYYKNTQLPYAGLTYYIAKDHTLMFSYNSVRRYPSFWAMQEYTTRSSEYAMSKGTPGLRACRIDALQLVYLFKNKYSLSVEYTMANDFLYSQPYLCPDTLLSISKTYNLGWSPQFQTSLNVPIAIGKWYRGNINPSVCYEAYNSDDWNGLSFHRASWRVSLNMSNYFTVSQKPYIVLNLSGWWTQKNRFALTDYPSRGSITAGATWQFADKRATLSLQCHDVFQSQMRSLWMTHYENQSIENRYNRKTRNIILSFSYRFKGYKERQTMQSDASRYGM